METAPTQSSERAGLSRLELAAFALVLLALIWAYAETFIYLIKVWEDPNYSYGYLVLPAALLILWLRRGSLDTSKVVPWRWGWALLAGVFVLRTILYERNEQWLEDATFPLAVGCLALAFGGWHLFRWSLPAIIFTGFMLPLPLRLNMLLAGPLQRLATIGSCNLLEFLGLVVVAEGNVINVGGQQLEVARACNGLSMLLSFITLVTLVVILIDRPILDRILLLASAIPIAMVVNILRISITGLCFNFFGTDELRLLFGWRLPHDWSGLLMPVMGLAAIWLELRLLSWLIVPEEEPEALPGFGPVGPAGYRPVEKKSEAGRPAEA